MEEIKQIELKVETKETREGKKFLTYKALQKDGRWIDCKFRKEVIPPKESCFIKVEKSKMNVDRNRKFPVLWVTEFIEAVPLASVRNADEYLDEMFG